MNTDTGQIKAMLDLTEDEKKSGKWVPVADEVAEAARTLNLEQKVSELRAKERQLEGLRKPGRR